MAEKGSNSPEIGSEFSDSLARPNERRGGCLTDLVVLAPLGLALGDIAIRAPRGAENLLEFSVGFLGTLALAYLFPIKSN